MKKDYRQKVYKNNVDHLADRLPWLELYADGTVLTRDLRLMKTWLVGFSDSVYSPDRWEDINHQVASWQQQQETGVVYYFDMLRKESNITFADPDSEVFGTVGYEIEKHRREIFSDPSMSNVTNWYISVLVPIDLTGKGIEERSHAKANAIFRSAETIFQTIDSTFTPLECSGGDAKKPWKPELSMLSYLATTISTRPRVVRAKAGGMLDISDYLVTEPLYNGKPLILGDALVQPITLKLFPAETLCAMLFPMQQLPFPVRWMTRWVPYSNFDSQQLTKKARTAARASAKSIGTLMVENVSGEDTGNYEKQAETDVIDIEQALTDQTHGETIGEFTSTIIVTARDQLELDERIQLVNEKLMQVEFGGIVEYRSACLFAWLGSLPGDIANNMRRPKVSATNLSEIIPFSNVYHGNHHNDYLEKISGVGFPHLIGKTVTNELYFLNLNGGKDDVGHTFIVGQTGGGKSIIMALLAQGWLRYPGSRVIYFDVDKSFANLCSRSGGNIFTPAEDENLNFMPLSRICTKPSEAMSWLELAISQQGIEVTPEVSKDIQKLCKEWDSSSIPTLERFTYRLKGINPENPGVAALERILSDPEMNTLFGGDVDNFTKEAFTRVTMVEMRKLMNIGNHALLPALAFLFNRVEELFNVPTEELHPTLLILDEAWSFLQHPYFRKKISDWLKTLRKKRVFVVLAIQNVNDLKSSAKDVEEFLSSCHTKIYLPVNKADLKGEMTEIYRSFGLNESQITALGEGIKKRHYLVIQQEGTALVDFCIDKYQLERIARDGA